MPSNATGICAGHMQVAYATRLCTDGRTDGLTDVVVKLEGNISLSYAREERQDLNQ